MKLKWEYAGEGETQISRQHVWATKCGRYRVVRSVSRLSEGEDRYVVGWRREADGSSRDQFLAKVGGNYPREFKLLEQALAAAEVHCAERFADDGVVESNAAQVVKAAAKTKLDRLPAGYQPKKNRNSINNAQSTRDNNRKEDDMTVQNVDKDSLVKLLTELGWPMAQDWDVARIDKKVRQLPQLVKQTGIQEKAEALDAPLQEALAAVLSAVESGKRIFLAPEPTTPSDNVATTEEPMYVSREELNQLLIGLGYAPAKVAALSGPRVLAKALKLAEQVRAGKLDEKVEALDQSSVEFLDGLVKAVARGKIPQLQEGLAPSRVITKIKASSNGKPKREGLSALDAAAKVLKERGRAIKPPELIDIMAKKNYWNSPGGKTPAATLSAAMYTEIKKKGKDSRFRKTEEGFVVV